MSTSINTNIAAYFAQANIAAASVSAQSSISRLSSGNAIVQASDNVAGLATGTSLATQVNALRTAQTNASQGSSLLQVADGALAQIQTILQQQQSVALQAKAGSLTNTDRGFLNQQFQALSNEINILATGTTFNGVNLIDGSIATGGSTSSNPLQNKAIVASTVQLGIGTGVSGFTDLTNAPSLVNPTFNQALAGTTYFSGSYTGSATGFTAGTTVTQPAGSYDKSLYGNLGTAGTFATTAVGAVGAITAYHVTYTSGDGTIYAGNINSSAATGTLTSGTVTLTATTNPATHATIAFTVGATGFTTASDNSLAIDTALTSNTTGATYTSGTFNAAPTLTQATSLNADASLRGDLSQGSFTVGLAVSNGVSASSTATAKGYQVSYTLNGTTYTGFLAGDGTAGHLGIASAGALALSSGDNVNHDIINLAVNTQFGASLTAAVDQSANIKSALVANFQGASALNTTTVATVSGEATQSGIGAVSVTSAPTKNDITFVGDLSKGVFTVSGSTAAGYNISFALNGSTYQGSLSAYQVTNGGKLVLDNGTGQLAFNITGNSAAANANTASSSALQSALTAQFSGATAHAKHLIASTLQSNGAGGTVPGSAITAASTAGTILDGFDGSKATLTSSTYDGAATNLPPVSGFSATGTGTSTVFSVNVGGTVYSTTGTVTGGTTLNTATINGASAGVVNFYKNGDATTNPNEVLSLDLSGISTGARIDTADAVTNVVNALNTAFGGGGGTGSGGLTFQLGTTVQSNVTVNIASAKTSTLYQGAALDISTANGAAAAAVTVGTAIDTVTSLRAGVGALESQFNFASAAIQSSVQNQDAARASLLDTDISTESTAFATQQVKLQAGISVLAQANQQLQALLKLIG